MSMELELAGQLKELLLSLLLGLGTGTVYDMLRPLRYRLGKAFALLLDMVFSASAFVLAFSFAMGAGSGRLGQWELCGILLGFLFYLHFLSPAFLEIFSIWTGLFFKGLSLFKNLLKKLQHSAKFIFKNVRECFIIKK